MKCTVCNGPMVEKKIDYEYVECGIRGVFLQKISVRTCRSCGEEEVSIPSIEILHKALAMAIATKKQVLRPNEVKFLRKYLGLSGKNFAEKMRVRPETVSRWENPKKEHEHIGHSYELLLRLIIISGIRPVRDYSEIDDWGTLQGGSFKVMLRHESDTWVPDAA